MKVTQIPFGSLNPKEIIALVESLKDRSIHLACPALTGNSIAMKILETIYGVHQSVVFIDRVNLANHTGCFFPDLALSIYPVLQKGIDEEIMINKIIHDLFEANEQHFKTDTLHVITEPLAEYNSALFLNCLELKLNDPNYTFQYLKSVKFSAF